MVAMRVGCALTGFPAVAPHGIDQQRLGQNVKEASEAKDHVVEAIDTIAEAGDVLRDAPADERRRGIQRERREQYDAEQDAPEFIHATAPGSAGGERGLLRPRWTQRGLN